MVHRPLMLGVGHSISYSANLCSFFGGWGVHLFFHFITELVYILTQQKHKGGYKLVIGLKPVLMCDDTRYSEV